MRRLEQFLRRQIDFGLTTDEENKMIDEEILEIEMRLSPKTQYVEFIEEFNKVRKAKYKPTIDSRRVFYETETLYTNSDRIQALQNALTNDWVQQNITVLKPEWILKKENIEKYINYAAPTKPDAVNTSGTISKTNYSKDVAL